MDVTAERVAKVPATNLRVSRELVAWLWDIAKRQVGTDNDYLLGCSRAGGWRVIGRPG